MSEKQKISAIGRNQRLSPEAYSAMCLKIRLAQLGKKKVFSDEHKRNISISRMARKKRLGYINSPETKLKIGLAKTGLIHSAETKLKMSIAKKGSSPKNLDSIKGWNKGIPHSEETKKKIGRNNFWKGKTGDKSFRWKGGITPFYVKVRNLIEYNTWRLNVFTRDGFSCRSCGCDRGGSLEAHHIKEFHKIMEENNIKTIEQALCCFELWDITNGTTLCENCHKKIHSKVI